MSQALFRPKVKVMQSKKHLNSLLRGHGEEGSASSIRNSKKKESKTILDDPNHPAHHLYDLMPLRGRPSGYTPPDKPTASFPWPYECLTQSNDPSENGQKL